MNTNLLIVEDNDELREELVIFFNSIGFSSFGCACGSMALKYVKENTIDICILDIMLPDISGFTVCNDIRHVYEGPILILTALGNDEDIIKGLNCGADDYITKPCSLKVLESRVNALLRLHRRGICNSKIKVIESGDLNFDLEHKTLFKEKVFIPLSSLEWNLCEALVKNAGKIVTRKYLLYAFWDDNEKFIEDNSLSVYVSRLRKKIGTCKGKQYFDTVKGIGYRWVFEINDEVTNETS